MALAKLNKEYAVRLCGVGAIMVALSVWSVYDGLVAWPKVNEDLAAVRPVLLEGCAKGVSPDLWLSAPQDESDTFLLAKVYADHGKKVPKHLVQELSAITKPEGNDRESRLIRANEAAKLFKEDVYPKPKLTSQYVQALITLVLGLLAFRAVWSKKGICYEVDEVGLRGSGFGAEPLAWDDIAKVDWAKWAEKGIVALHAKDGRRFVLDGWHFAGMKPIAAEIEKHFPIPA